MLKAEDAKNHKKYESFIRSIIDIFELGTNSSSKKEHISCPPHLCNSQYSILLCSPHPDDEALVGAFALRAKKENKEKVKVVNCAITLGSDISKRKKRFKELRSSCNVLDFELEIPGFPDELGFDNVSPQFKKINPEQWNLKVQNLLKIFQKVKPDFLIIPHSKDWHITHKGTNALAIDTAREYLKFNPERNIVLIETEYWQPMENPNLIIGVSAATEALLVTAIAEHRGEVNRNAYHLKHPARMIDNVRRGSEIILGKGSKSCNFLFGELYRISSITRRKIIRLNKSKYVVHPDEPFSLLKIRDIFI